MEERKKEKTAGGLGRQDHVRRGGRTERLGACCFSEARNEACADDAAIGELREEDLEEGDG